jgi:hypothetical protein
MGTRWALPTALSAYCVFGPVGEDIMVARALSGNISAEATTRNIPGEACDRGGFA